MCEFMFSCREMEVTAVTFYGCVSSILFTVICVHAHIYFIPNPKPGRIHPVPACSGIFNLRKCLILKTKVVQCTLMYICMCTPGVEKNNDTSKRNYFSSNKHDAPGEIIRSDYRLNELQR